MNRFDTLYLRIHGSVARVKPEFESDFRRQAYPGWGNYQWNRPQFPNDPRIKFIAPDSQSINIGLSSRVLGSKFHELINLNNVEVIAEELSGYLDFEKGEFLSNLEVGLCHITLDVLLEELLYRYLLPLACIAHPDFNTRRYKAGKVSFDEIVDKKIQDLETVVFQKYALSKEAGERITFYDKLKELQRKSKGRYSRPQVSHDEVHKYFKNRLRVERVISGYSKIRKVFKLPAENNPRLIDVLSSPERPLVDLFNRIRAGSKPSLTEQYPLKQPINRIIKEFGWEKVINDCKRDPGLIKDYFGPEMKGNPTTTMKWIRNRIEALNLKDLNIATEKSKGLLDEIESKLLNS